MWLYKIPYQFAMVSTFAVGLASVPMVFHRDTALWFCENYVKGELPVRTILVSKLQRLTLAA